MAVGVRGFCEWASRSVLPELTMRIFMDFVFIPCAGSERCGEVAVVVCQACGYLCAVHDVEHECNTLLMAPEHQCSSLQPGQVCMCVCACMPVRCLCCVATCYVMNAHFLVCRICAYVLSSDCRACWCRLSRFSAVCTQRK